MVAVQGGRHHLDSFTIKKRQVRVFYVDHPVCPCAPKCVWGGEGCKNDMAAAIPRYKALNLVRRSSFAIKILYIYNVYNIYVYICRCIYI